MNLIETARLQLRKPTKTDEVILRDLWKDDKVRRYLGGIITDSMIDEKIAQLESHWHTHGFGQCSVIDKSDNKIIGICGLHHSEDGVEVSYMFFPEWWGNGFATEAIVASFEYGFNKLKFEKIITITQEANNKSCRLLENIGMCKVNNFLRYNATQCLYEMTQSDWQDRKCNTLYEEK